MTCNFRVGQKVVCVDDAAILESDGVKRLYKGRVYTIRRVRSDYSAPGFLVTYGGPFIWLDEIKTRGNGDHPFGWMRFRPVVQRKTNISVFQALLTPSKEKVETAL